MFIYLFLYDNSLIIFYAYGIVTLYHSAVNFSNLIGQEVYANENTPSTAI